MKDPDLVIHYCPDSDTLRLSAGAAPAEGETIAQWLMVEWSRDEEITGVVLRNAAKVLRPYLFPDAGDLSPDNDSSVYPDDAKSVIALSSADNRLVDPQT